MAAAGMMATTALFLCSCHGSTQKSGSQTEVHDTVRTHTPKDTITADMAYYAVSKYCHDTYDWNVSKEHPGIMYLKKGEDTETEYLIIFRSYTAAHVYFYVNKKTGKTRIVEKAPYDDSEEVGTETIDLDFSQESENIKPNKKTDK